MKDIIEFLKSHKYYLVVSILVFTCILLSVTFSSFIVTSNNHKAAEMYIGSLKYSISIDSNETNTITVEPGVTVIDVDVNNLNTVDTYYKLLYLKNSNIDISYYEKYKNISYSSPNANISKQSSSLIKLKITNNSTSVQNIEFKVSGGYITNDLSEIKILNSYVEIVSVAVDNVIYCTYDGDITQGTEYTLGDYTYRYKQDHGANNPGGSSTIWQNIDIDGWGVMFKNNNQTSISLNNFCTYINDKPVVSMGGMFSEFYNTTVTTITGFENLNTSNIISVENMFNSYGEYSSTTISLDLSGLNTSNVENMRGMFMRSIKLTSLNLSNLDTSNVKYMDNMFEYLLDLKSIDLSSFDTHNVISMSGMFGMTGLNELDLSSFDTSNVTNMSSMFSNCQATTLDLSSFDTSNVTDMYYMFYNNPVKTIYVSNKFNTDNVTNSDNMFDARNLVGGAGTKYNDSYTDKTYARIDGGTSNPGYFTDIADKDIPEPNSFSTDIWKTIIKAVKNNNISKYNVGDTKTIDMGSYGTHTLRIANTSTPSECSTSGFSQTACGFVLEFADVITTHKMNDTQTNKGGWPATSMRTFLNNDIYNSLPSDLKNGIIDTTVVSSHGSEDSSNFTSTDKLYLLAPTEIYSDFNNSYDTAKNLTRQLDYYKNEEVTSSSYSKTKKMYNSSALYWWLRSAYPYDNYNFSIVTDSGGWSSSFAAGTSGVSPAFRIG